MALSKKPVTGMKDIMPAEMQIRDYVIATIKETYGAFGFTSIDTPCVENIANLSNKQGGENEKLIFKILKRGEKLQLDQAKAEGDLVDSGLRYDLTVPLARFYSNHANELPTPFKSLQMGYVWRADRPQRGRFRQFMQCDIDILGEASNMAEMELILATSSLLGKLGFRGFKIRVNDRRILKAMAAHCGFPEDAYDQVFIIWDKMDKIGIEGVCEELLQTDFTQDSVERYRKLFASIGGTNNNLMELYQNIAESLEESIYLDLQEIMDVVQDTKSADFEVVFDPTLVRGMSYYTGPIFEVDMVEFSSSCGGGGRYDQMIGNFTGKDTPACGLSIGFERIITILLENDFQVPGSKDKCVYLVEKGIPTSEYSKIIQQAQAAREQGTVVLVNRMNKNKKHQKEQLMAEGYTQFVEFYATPLR